LLALALARPPPPLATACRRQGHARGDGGTHRPQARGLSCPWEQPECHTCSSCVCETQADRPLRAGLTEPRSPAFHTAPCCPPAAASKPPSTRAGRRLGPARPA
jgi:hypothetical protein